MSDGWTVNDLEPPLAGTISNGTVAVDLSAATQITALIKRPGASTLVRTAVKGNQTLAKGSWSMAWQVGDLCVPYAYSVSLRVEWPGVRPQTFGPFKFPVAPATV